MKSPSLRRVAPLVLCWMAALFVSVGMAEEAPPAGLPRCDPATVGMDADVLAQVPARMRQFVEAKQAAGVVTLVARRGCVVHLEAVGYADLAEQRPMTTDTIFEIASMTKPVTATAVMILKDEGKIALDDPVAKYLPEFSHVTLASGPPARPITIRQLLTHTAGLVGEQRTERTLEETAAEIAKRPLGYEPGTKWQYSPGLNVCGRIIEVVSGTPYAEFMSRRILRPLGMTDTSFCPTDEQRKRLARLYKPGADKPSLAPDSHWLLDDAGQRAANPSGGLFSTASDMARFYQMVLNGGQFGGRRILSKEAVEEMTRLQTGDLTTAFTPGNGWGLGWCIVLQPQGVTRMLSPGTFGHGGAFGTQGWIDPKREMIFVLMIQRAGFGNGDASELRDALQDLAVKAVRSP